MFKKKTFTYQLFILGYPFRDFNTSDCYGNHYWIIPTIQNTVFA